MTNLLLWKPTLGSLETLSIVKKELALEEISVWFSIDSMSAITINNLETFKWFKKHNKNKNSFLKPTKTKILIYGAKSVSSLQIKGAACQLTVETCTKITTTLFYIIDSNSHHLLIKACATELDLICLHHATSEKREEILLNIYDWVLVKQPRQNKLSQLFRPYPCRIISKKGTMLTAKHM